MTDNLLGASLADKNKWNSMDKTNNRCSLLRREIAVDGKPYRVEFDNCTVGAALSIKVNGKPVEVTLEKEPEFKKPFIIKVHGKPYLVELTRIDRQAPFSVKVNNTLLKVELKSTVKKMLVTPTSQASVVVQRPTKKISEEGVITAPMAGKIISVKVKKGDTVKSGDVLCTLEAMKMENEVTAPKNGIILEVTIQEGKTVNADDILIVIK